MKPLRYRSAPLGEQISSTDNAKSKVVTATKDTWVAGTAETNAFGDIVYTDPYTLTPQDLYSWPLIVNVSLYGLIEGFADLNPISLRFYTIATTLDKELPVRFTQSTATNTFPTTTVAKQATPVSVHQHLMNAGSFTPGATTRRFLWKYDAQIAIISAQVENEKASVGAGDYGTMQWRQITHSRIFLNSNAGDTFVPVTTDASNTVLAHANFPEALSSSKFDCTNGMKFAVGASYAGTNSPRLLLLGGLIHCSPEENRTPTLLGNLSL